MSESPLRIIRPLAVPAQFFVVCLWSLLFMGLSALLARMLWEGIEKGPFHPIALVFFPLALSLGAAGLLFLPLGAGQFLIEPRYTVYKVFPDRVEYYGGFFNRTQRRVAFDQEITVRLNRGLLQRAAGVGTVTLLTWQLVPGHDGQLTKGRFALAIWNVPEPQQVYDLIRSLVTSKRSPAEQCAAADRAGISAFRGM
jgi:hypothetical protein